jgi:hypothetical protein
MVYPVGPNDASVYLGSKKGDLSPEQQKKIDEIIKKLQKTAPPWTEAIKKIHAVLESNPTLSTRAQNLLNQALGHLKEGEVAQEAISTLENL